jgi:hypothetical protein
MLASAAIVSKTMVASPYSVILAEMIFNVRLTQERKQAQAKSRTQVVDGFN